MGTSGRVFAVVPRHRERVGHTGGGPRGDIRDWSSGSRRRLLFGLGCLDFERERGRRGRWVSLTLTYGRDPGSDRFRRDRLAWLQALRDRYGTTKHVWKVEFHQHWRGGVPHLHMMLLLPRASEGALRDLRRWGWDRWEKIAGDRYRFDARWTSARVMATYVSADYTMQGRKSAQYRVPEGWGSVGRWWAINGLRARWTSGPVRHRDFVMARALVRLHYAATSERSGTTEGHGGAWVLVDNVRAFRAAVFGFLEGGAWNPDGLALR